MICWLPFPSFSHSVAALSDQRLEQQCCEALRLLHDVRGGSFEPSAQMWVGYEAALALYGSLAVLEWEARNGRPMAHVPPYVVNPGYKAEGAEPLFPNPRSEHLGWLPPVSEIQPPGWLGREDIHESHRARLLTIDPDQHRAQFTEKTRNDLVWP